MSDKKLIHRPVPNTRGTLAERLSTVEAHQSELAEKIPRLIVSSVLAATKKMHNEMYPELYDALAAEHGRVFEVQEKAFMRVTENLHARLCVLEAAAGLASPDLEQFRALVDAVAEEVGADGLSPESDIARATENDLRDTYADSSLQSAIDQLGETPGELSLSGNSEPWPGAGAVFTEDQADRTKGIQ